MDLDDLVPRKSDAPLDGLEGEDLDGHSISELEERKRRLAREIVRVEAVIKEKEASKSAAESVFGGPS